MLSQCIETIEKGQGQQGIIELFSLTINADSFVRDSRADEQVFNQAGRVGCLHGGQPLRGQSQGRCCKVHVQKGIHYLHYDKHLQYLVMKATGVACPDPNQLQNKRHYILPEGKGS